jgi:hypothetical protein
MTRDKSPSQLREDRQAEIEYRERLWQRFLQEMAVKAQAMADRAEAGE